MANGATLAPGTVPVDPGPGGLAPDLVHRTVVRTPPGAAFAGGWIDDTPETGADTRQKEGS